MTQAQGTTLAPSSPPIAHSSIVPEHVKTRISFGPAPAWVIQRDVDESYRPAGGGPHSILLLDRQRRFSDFAHFERLVRRLETLQAVQEAAQWRLDFDPATQRVELHTLLVRREGSAAEHATPERVRLLQREENLERYILDGWVSLVVLLEDVRVGDIIEASFTIHTEPRLFSDHHWYFCMVPWAAPIRAFHLRTLFPKGAPAQWKSDLPQAAPDERELGEEIEWTWTLENTVPVEPEPEMPDWYFPGRWFQVSDFLSWGDVAAGMLAEWREDLSAPELRQMVEQISADRATLIDRAERAIVLVQDEIRYLSCNEEFGGQTPSPPGAVLQRRFGDCKDKTFLLVHLLRLLGIPARPVLVHSQWRQTLGKLLPMPAAFNHVIVEYELEGERRWCDGTSPMQGGGPLGRAVPEFKLGLPISPGVTSLEQISPPQKVQHTLDLHEAFHLDTTGKSSAFTMVLTASGMEADHLRCSLALEGPEAVGRAREKFYHHFFPDLQRNGDLEWRDDRERNRLTIALRFDIKKPFASEIPRQGLLFHYRAHLVQSVLGLPAGEKRRHPFALRHPCDFRHTIEVHSSGLTGVRSERRRPPGRDFFFEMDVRFQTGRATFAYRLRTAGDSVDPFEYNEHSRIVRDVWQYTNVDVTLPSGIPLLHRKRLEESLLDPVPAGVRRRPGGQGERHEDVPAPVTPSAPAPLLQSLPPENQPPIVARVPDRARSTQPSEKARPDAVDRPQMIHSASSTREDGAPRRRRRPHRRRSSSQSDRTWLFLLLVIGLVFVSVIVTLSMNKK